MPPWGILPLIVSPRIDEIQIIEDFPAEVYENEQFHVPPKIKVLKEGRPVEGVQCYTSIIMYGEYYLNLDYKLRKYNMNPKDLMFSQAGLYSYDSIYPFKESKIEYYYTDSNGEITFPHVKFTGYGVGDQMHQ